MTTRQVATVYHRAYDDAKNITGDTACDLVVTALIAQAEHNPDLDDFGTQIGFLLGCLVRAGVGEKRVARSIYRHNTYHYTHSRERATP